MSKFELEEQSKVAIVNNTKSDVKIKSDGDGGIIVDIGKSEMQREIDEACGAFGRSLKIEEKPCSINGIVRRSFEVAVSSEFKFMSDDKNRDFQQEKAKVKKIIFFDKNHLDVYKSKVSEWPSRVISAAFSKNGSVPLSSRIREAKLFRFNGTKRMAFFEFKSEDFGVFYVECEVSKEVKGRLKKCKNQSARVVAVI